MDSIYLPKTYCSSEPFNTKKYFQKYGKCCPFTSSAEDMRGGNQRQIIALDMAVSADEYDFNTLEESCR